MSVSRLPGLRDRPVHQRRRAIAEAAEVGRDVLVPMATQQALVV